ncbi:transporter [Dyella sp. C11]|uniref:SphA family protein n=1 Tax=Dyella sp. C11 TaxID=2126991 RepID=UPI000D657312|nr:transporter [Dyella sp. C11]
MRWLLKLAMIFALSQPTWVSATEGALGRSITGAQITSYVGIVPPSPGLQVSLSYVYYSGTVGGARQAPVGGLLAVDTKATANLYAAALIYVWNTGQGRWNFASMFTLPYMTTDATADVAFAGRAVRTTDSSSALYDLYFAPVIASYHVSEVEHWSFGVYVYAPTADFQKGKLANDGLNVWTTSPAVGYTHLFQQGTFEFSALAGIDIYSRNNATDYQNGSVFRLDALVMKRLPNGWGFGVDGGWIYQLQDDSGPTARLLNGFKGHALAVGPAIEYAKTWDKDKTLSFNLRWMKEFDVTNRVKGDPLVLVVNIPM